MSYAIHKSNKYGPFRFNVSQSGIGLALGKRADQLVDGPLHAEISFPPDTSLAELVVNQELEVLEDTARHVKQDADALVDSSSTEILALINQRIGIPRFSGLVVILVTLTAIGLFVILSPIIRYIQTLSAGLHTFVSLFYAFSLVTFWLIGLWVAWVTHKQERWAKTIELDYMLDLETQEQFDGLNQAIHVLGHSKRIWRIAAEELAWDVKRNATGAPLSSRKPVRAFVSSLKHLKTSLDVSGLSLDSLRLYFLPDCLYIYQNGRYGSVRYEHLRLEIKPIRFIEERRIPKDAKIVATTWMHVTEQGAPDEHYKDNRRISVVVYGQLDFSSDIGFNLTLLVSNPGRAKKFAEAMEGYIAYLSGRTQNSTDHWSYRYKPEGLVFEEEDEEHLRPYRLLGLAPSATPDEIEAAYRKLVREYQPDNLEDATPEYMLIAEERITALNEAYDQLKRSFDE